MFILAKQVNIGLLYKCVDGQWRKITEKPICECHGVSVKTTYRSWSLEVNVIVIVIVL